MSALAAAALGPLIALVSGVMYLALDRSPIGGDASQYALATIRLYDLVTTPVEFLRGLITISPGKPNGIIWLATPFVGLWPLTGSVDRAIQVPILLMQVLTLVLVYRAVREAAPASRWPAVAAALALCGSPHVVNLGRVFLVEPLQTFSVAWFLLILVCASRWSRALVMAQLVAATAVALSSKVTQPVLCVCLGVAAVLCLLRTRGRNDERSELRAIAITLLVGLPFFAATATWYVVNRSWVKSHLVRSAFGPEAKNYWGTDAPYLDNVVFWTRSAIEPLFVRGFDFLAFVVIFAGALAWWRRREPGRPAAAPAAVVVVQIVTVIAVFALSSTRLDRFIAPVMPLIAFLIGWALASLRSRTAVIAATVLFALQALAVHAIALQVLPFEAGGIRKAQLDTSHRRTIDTILQRTCSGETAAGPRHNVFAIELTSPSLEGDWLAPEPLNYEVARRGFESGRAPGCRFDYAGGAFFGAPLDRAWEQMLDRDVRFVIVADPAVIEAGPTPMNEVFRGRNPELLLERLRADARFTFRGEAGRLGLLVFERSL